MTPEVRKLWMRDHRKKQREKELLKRNQCPMEGCGMSLAKRFEEWHVNCEYYKFTQNSQVGQK